MGRVIIGQNELPYPDDKDNGNKINRFRYRVVNNNRNQYSDWSVVNYAEQQTLKPESRDGMPPGGLTGEVPAKQSDTDYDIGWEPITGLIPPGTYAPGTNDYVSTSTDSQLLVPGGGAANEVLTKNSATSGDTKWSMPYYVPTNGFNAQILVKTGSLATDYQWVTVNPDIFSYGSGSVYDPIAEPPYPVGGTVTQFTLGGSVYRAHAFYYVGPGEIQTFQVYKGVIGKVLVVAGGGGGGGSQGQTNGAGGGGGGGTFYGDYAFGAGGHNISVGRGGAGGNAGAWWNGGHTSGTNGGNSYIDYNPATQTGGILRHGGGGGGAGPREGWGSYPGLDGGSGGGGGAGGAGGAGITGEGFAGSSNGYGGGAVGSGDSPTFGKGLESTVLGTLYEYGSGGIPTSNNVPDANSGRGGGGGAYNSSVDGYAGQRGADGIVVCRYRIS